MRHTCAIAAYHPVVPRRLSLVAMLMATVEPTEFSFSPAEERVLAALSRRPLGLYPVSSVALAANTELAAAGAALERLSRLGFVERTEECVPSRPVRREAVWKVTVEAWRHAADVLCRTCVPELVSASLPERLPDRFGHLFWWGDPSLYRLPDDAVFIAEQILTCDDASSWGWALFSLPLEALDAVAARSHIPRDRRDLAAAAVAWRRDATQRSD